MTIRIMFLFLFVASNAIAQQTSGNASPNGGANASIDPEHIFFTQPVKGPITDVTEPSDAPIGDSDVALVARRPCPINDRPASDDQVVLGHVTPHEVC